ncbi:MAG: hypothetical protein E7287_01315 [Lachnospiraceae bacterium]|nr:hypothetical protein [Lachnospiraceae bacterium]
MSSHENNKQDGALRIFEALSGVDVELLDKCESATRVSEASKVIPFWKYGKAMVACVCILLAGGLLFAMPRMSQKSASEADCARPEYAYDGVLDESTGSASMQESVKDACTEAVTEEDFVEETVDFDGAANKEMMQESDCSDGLMVDNATGCVKDLRVELKEEQLRGMDVLGEYLPVRLPAGYRFESASAGEGDDTETYADVSVLWSRGLDDIRWKVKRVDVSEIVCVDITETEKYDVHLYEIPYAETVPEEYREIFDGPVFRAGDVSLEVIERRMKTIRDAGDTDTPRGNFSVLFEEGILVEFSGRATAQEVLNAFDSLLR